MSMHSETGVRSVAASSMLRRHRSVVLKLTERGYELTSEGGRLSEGKEIVVRTQG
jgi:hypothetical protein